MRKFFFHDPKLLIYGFLIIFFASYGQTFFISLFNDDIKNLYSLTDGQFGLVYALSTTLSSLLLVNFAKLIDFIDLRIYSFFNQSLFSFRKQINRHGWSSQFYMFIELAAVLMEFSERFI